MKFDYAKLRGRIIETCGTQSAFAAKIGLSEHSVSQKLNNRRGWKQAEMQQAVNILGIAVTDICTYFFTPKVQ